MSSTASLTRDAWVLDALANADAPPEVLELTRVLLVLRELMGPGMACLAGDIEAEESTVAWILNHAVLETEAQGGSGSALGDACLFLLTGARRLGDMAGDLLAHPEALPALPGPSCGSWGATWFGVDGEKTLRQWTYAWDAKPSLANAWRPAFDGWSRRTRLETRPVGLFLGLIHSGDDRAVARGLALGALLSMRSEAKGLPWHLASSLSSLGAPGGPSYQAAAREAAGLIGPDQSDLRMWVLRDLACRINRSGALRSLPAPEASASLGVPREPLLEATFGRAHAPLGWVVLALAMRSGWPDKKVLLGCLPGERDEIQVRDGYRWAMRAALDYSQALDQWKRGILEDWWMPDPDLIGSGQLHAQVALSLDELWRVEWREQ